MRKVGTEWHGACPACGPGKSGPDKTDRFSVKGDGRFFCRICTPRGGDAVTFLRKFENKSCPEAHRLLDTECDSTTCPVAGKCSQGKKGGPVAPRPLRAPKKKASPEFTPATATTPEEKWRARAEKLIAQANAALLDCPEQLAYLAKRGLPREAVERYRLGWLEKDMYRPRAAWGLPEEISPRTRKPKKLWIPAGIVIPFFSADGAPERIRVRRHKINEGDARYYWVPGSGNDVPVIGEDARGFVVVESDLDAFLVHWHAGDLVGAIPLGSCSPKPKETAMAALRHALAILVALDFEPRENERTGRHENPGGQAARWWLEQFRRAVRWPVPAGKDPGEFYQDHDGDIREWVLGGLPLVFHVDVPTQQEEPAQPVPAPDVEKPETPAPESNPEGLQGGYIRGVSEGGRPYLVAEARDDLPKLREEFPDDIPFHRQELNVLKGRKPEGAVALLGKSVFSEGVVVAVRPVSGDGRPESAKFDPSVQRRKRWEGCHGA